MLTITGQDGISLPLGTGTAYPQTMTPTLPRRLAAGFALLLTLAAGSAAAPLFNGENLDGWTVENNGQFSVADGILTVNRGTGWLRSNEQYSDFILTLELTFGEARANSGIFIRTAGTSDLENNGWPDNGYQVQCMDTTQGANPIGGMIFYGASQFEQIFNRAAIEANLKPPGEWNTVEITARGGNIAVRLNGVLINLVQGVTKLTGHVGIQGENGLLMFRKIDIQKL